MRAIQLKHLVTGVLAGAILLPAITMAQIFKRVDRDGAVHFSDQRTSDAQPVRLGEQALQVPANDKAQLERRHKKLLDQQAALLREAQEPEPQQVTD